MQIEDFVKVYQGKNDEELIQLAATREQLTSEARLALQGELSRREISIAEDSETNQHDGGGHDVGRESTNKRPLEGEWHGVGNFVSEVLRTYHSHFWLFFKITAPAVIISTVAIMTGRNEIREIARHLPRGVEVLEHRAQILDMYLVTFAEFLVSWMAFSFSYGAICIAVEETTAGFTASARHSLLNVRERLGPLLGLSLLLFLLTLLAVAASFALETGVFWALRRWQGRPSGLVIMVVTYGFACLAVLIISRFALAVPAIVLDDCRVGQAIFRSDELTQGKWLTLAVLLAKSLIGDTSQACARSGWCPSFMSMGLCLRGFRGV